MDLSFIILNWNTKDLTIGCIESIIEDNLEIKYEIIVIDNASSDGSVEEIRERFPNVFIHRNEFNLGFSKANNIGIEISKGKYVCLLNSDIKIKPICFSPIIEYMKNNQDTGILGPRILNMDGSFQATCRRMPNLWNNFIEAIGLHNLFPKSRLFSGEFIFLEMQKEPCEVEVLTGCFWFINRKALDEVGLLDDMFYFYGEDKDFSFRFKNAGWKVIFFPMSEAYHLFAASSSKNPEKYLIEKQKAHFQLLNKHYSPSHRRVMKVLRMLYLLTRIIVKPIIALVFFRKKIRRDSALLESHASLKALSWIIFRNGLKE